jgi:hypothetical protein
MAAPHVSGVVALLWSLWPQLKAAQIHAVLCGSARTDSFTGESPDVIWGAGKLDAQRAYEALLTLIERGETQMENQVVTFRTASQNGTEGGMEVRIELGRDNTVVVSGTSDGRTYDGKLILRRKKNEADEVNDLPEGVPAPGGDECWINGVWYANCPP